jgi:hypothetical protein
VESAERVAVGAEVQLFVGLDVAPRALRAIGRVVRTAPGGFAARFVDESEEGRNHVDRFLARHAQAPVAG